MNIVFVSYFSGISSRGVETYVHELSLRLVKLGHQVTVIQSGPTIVSKAYHTLVLPLPLWLFNFTLFFKIPPATDFLIPTNGRLQTLVSKIWTFIFRKFLIVSGQSGLGADDKWNLWCFPNHFIALTNHQSRWAANVNPHVKISVIPNGVDLQKFSPTGPKAKITLPSPRVISVAALVPIKRLHLLIQAVSQTPASLVLVGSGPQALQLQQLGDQLLPGRFQIISAPHSQIPALLRTCQLFAFTTSPWEAFGIAIIEAMAVGLPVVATADPIRRELVGSAGILADPVAQNSFSHAITSLLAQPPSISPQAQAAKFSWDKIALAYHQLFQKYVS